MFHVKFACQQSDVGRSSPKCGMSKRDAVNDPPFFAFDRDSATDILQSAGSDVTTKKSAMEVNMPF